MEETCVQKMVLDNDFHRLDSIIGPLHSLHFFSPTQALRSSSLLEGEMATSIFAALMIFTH